MQALAAFAGVLVAQEDVDVDRAIALSSISDLLERETVNGFVEILRKGIQKDNAVRGIMYALSR